MTDTARFVLLFVGFSLVLASVAAFAFTVEHRSHCAFGGVRDDPRGEFAARYDELDPGQRATFRELIANRDETFSGPCPPDLVRYEGRYYAVDGWNTIVWTNPPTLASLAGVLVGAVLCYRALPREARFLGRFDPR